MFHKEADFLDDHLQRKVGLGWSSEAVDVNIHGLWESSTQRYLTRTDFFFKASPSHPTTQCGGTEFGLTASSAGLCFSLCIVAQASQ